MALMPLLEYAIGNVHETNMGVEINPSHSSSGRQNECMIGRH